MIFYIKVFWGFFEVKIKIIEVPLKWLPTTVEEDSTTTFTTEEFKTRLPNQPIRNVHTVRFRTSCFRFTQRFVVLSVVGKLPKPLCNSRKVEELISQTFQS